MKVIPKPILGEWHGVKKLIILAIVPKASENYNNMKLILDLMGISALYIDFTYAVDMKMADILEGIQAHRSTHPCACCVKL